MKLFNNFILFIATLIIFVGCQQQEEKSNAQPSSEQQLNNGNELPSLRPILSRSPTAKDSNPSVEGIHYEYLKELSWLVGDWVDDEPDVDVKSSFKWSVNKNFLIQHFTVKDADNKEFEGYQIIGWNPNKNRIKSWIFDTDGGFGESAWGKQGDSWYASTGFVLPDGRKASTVHIYTKVNEDTYTFASNSRDVDGVLQPDIGPFKMIKKSAEAQ